MAEQHRVVKIHCPGCGQKMDVSEVCAFSRIVCPVCGGEVIVPDGIYRWRESPDSAPDCATARCISCIG